MTSALLTVCDRKFHRLIIPLLSQKPTARSAAFHAIQHTKLAEAVAEMAALLICYPLSCNTF
ncbi:MAG: hypothetical protein ACPHF4_11870, partial [Rubripirellula sp.]